MDFDDIRDSIPNQSPVQPRELSLDAEFQFDCHPGVSCFNACCKQSDIQLTPYDVIRLKRRLKMTSAEFVARYTVPFEMDQHGMPGLRLATAGKSSCCTFLSDDGCRVYEDRPVACRYYALGNMAMRKIDEPRVEEVFFVVREDHCKGHEEPVRQTVRDYLDKQGIPDYQEANREWMDVVIKKRTSGPTVGSPSARSLQLFDMCSYDMDSFRKFVQTPGFQNIFDVPPDEMTTVLSSDENLLVFSMRFLKQVLFGEMRIRVKEGAREQRVAVRKEEWKRRREEEIQRQRDVLEQARVEEAAQFASVEKDGNDDDDGSLTVI